MGIRILAIVAFVFAGYFIRYSVRRDNHNVLRVSLLFGAGAAIAALIFNTTAQHVFHLADGLDPKSNATVEQIVVSTAIFVVIEEVVKFVPMALFLLRKKYFTMLSDGVLYFGLAGLMFGTIEHLLYGAGFGEATLLVRIFLVLFLHAGLTGLVGYFYAKDRILGNRFRTIVALLLAMSLHYIYNLGLFLAERRGPGWEHIGLVAMSSAIATGLNCLLVWLFYVTSQRDWHRLKNAHLPTGPVSPEVSIRHS